MCTWKDSKVLQENADIVGIFSALLTETLVICEASKPT